MTARYGQLSYTSFETAQHMGGWQVKETSADLTAEEIRVLTAGVRTVFRPARPLPAYPTGEQLESGPRRLAYGRLDRQRAGYWHTVPAGSDSTGRPGNVFAHAMLDRRAGDRAARPIQWWRSSQWLRPYGAPAVGSAALPPTPPAPGTAVTPTSVVDFALDPGTWRLTTLFGLLDAVVAALAGGPPVVLGTESADSAAQWIGLVSYLMSPGTAATLNFSTFDRADQLTLARQSRQHLTAVPIEDFDELPEDVVAIDETGTLSLGELGREPHRTANGRTIEVTPWSAMAQVVLLDADSAHRVLEDIDHYAAQVADVGLHPAWPMAMSVAHCDSFADALMEAHTVIAAHSPWAANDSVVARTIAEVMRTTVGTTTEDAWHAVQDMPAGPAADLAAVTYLCRALADEEWLTRPGPIHVCEGRFERHTVPTELHAAIGAAVSSAADPERLLRLADLLLRAGIRDDRVTAALAAEVVPQLTGAEAVDRLGAEVGASARRALATVMLRRNVETGAEPPVPAVLKWLAEGLKTPEPEQVSRSEPWDDVWTRAALRGLQLDRGDEQNAADRWLRLWWLRVSGAPSYADVAGASVWRPEELLHAAGDSALPGAAVVRTLVGSPHSPELERLSRTVLAANTDDTAVACAAVRTFDPRTWIEHGYTASHQSAYTPLWESAVATVGRADLHRDFAVRLVTLAAIAAIAGRPYPPVCTALASDVAVAGEAFGQLAALVDQYVLSPVSLLAVVAVRWSQSGEEFDVVFDGVEDLLWQVARHVLRTHSPETLDLTAIAMAMGQLTGDFGDGGMRRHHRTVQKLMARRREQTVPIARTRWTQ
ncbi:hypothetical protein [Mycolicibacterium sp. F2034L]|uniref:GAP1-N2 domain-containing protein n=1 Tax=Mycolicibacterium sp. F2034L TaxID=2926422 RepID=UPI001FF4D309|nr:hypothetical protein [Mycolicibacterium sp. F2034L]MCK0176026.1 hypothetical protein [Mycolicibacterium sp. F2034L]